MDALVSIPDSGPFSEPIQKKAIEALESGAVIFLPDLPFVLEPSEEDLLTPTILKKGVKNISFDPNTAKLGGHAEDKKELVKEMLHRFSTQACAVIGHLFPHYLSTIRMGRTSFRPIEIAGRASTSYRKNDKLLHVDSFPSTPTRGERILRFFSNINPQGKERVWCVGEPFSSVAKRFLPKIPKPLPGTRKLLNWFGITRGYRTLYDHYMLHLHNKMKGDSTYQNSVPKTTVRLPPNSSWFVFTDQTSHSVLSGQHVLEQTFYLPVAGMHNPEKSPLKVLENQLQTPLLI